MNNPEPPSSSWRQFIAALGIVLAGVAVGYIITSRHDGPRPVRRPTALGHNIPMIHMTNASEIFDEGLGVAETNKLVTTRDESPETPLPEEK